MGQTGEEFFAAGMLGQPGADAAAKGNQLLPAQLLDQARVAGEHHAQQWLRVEARTGQQAQLAQRLRTHLLRLVDQQHCAATRTLQVGQPAFAQGLGWHRTAAEL